MTRRTTMVRSARHGIATAATMLGLAVMATACGRATDQNATADPPQLPATTTLVLPTSTAPVSIDLARDVAALDVECPRSADLSAGDGGSFDATLAESSRLEPMLGQVLAYGGEHPAEFGTYGLVWYAVDDASVFISFSGPLDDHRDALMSIVSFPDELVVCSSALSGDELAALQATLSNELSGRFLSVGRSSSAVTVELPPGAEATAADLIERYGAAVEVRVGMFTYPIDDASPVCFDVPGPTAPADLDVAVVPGSEVVSPDDLGTLSVTLVLTNTGDGPVSFSSGTASGTLVAGDGRVVSGGALVAMADVGIGIDIAVGGSTELNLVAGIASCDPAVGSALPPGEYGLVASILRDGTTFHTAPMPITVVAG